MGAVMIPATNEALEGTEDEPLTCNNEHEFTRGELDVIRTLIIQYEGAPEEFKLEDFPVSMRHECPQCTCAVEDDSIYPVTDPDDEAWLCTGCGRKYDSEEDALDCHP